jgi:flagellar basal body rod protein FlgG
MQRIEERAADVRRAFTPGAQPSFDDVDRSETSYPTLDPLSAAPPANGYFVTRGENGALRYTRNGSLVLREGILCSGDGRPVLGYARRGGLSDLSVDRVDLALGRTSNARIDERGNLVYDRAVVDPRSGAREMRSVVAGRIALARFPAGTRLVDDGGGFEAPQGVAPRYGAAGDGDFAPLATMRRQSSGVDIDRSIERLRIAYRELDAMQGVYRTQYATDKTAMDVVK